MVVEKPHTSAIKSSIPSGLGELEDLSDDESIVSNCTV